ncbi:galactokinase, partial [Acidimicrobiaceae bacterium USS-CC1]|nr:galactokinase [Acidiferrimicrobium australe]
GHALFIDFASDTTETVPLAGVGPLVVVDTGVRHDHTTGEYGARRRDCEAAAAALGLPDLRAADLAMVETRLSGRLAARARHVVTENERVGQAVARLQAGQEIGHLLSASHRSLRDDFEVSCPELDVVAEAVVRSGASGARMTGGGFGGCVIVAGMPEADVRVVASAALAKLGQVPAAVFEALPSGPAARVL